MPVLRARIGVLRAKFVDAQLAAERAEPLTFKPDIENLAAFRLLVHAELEEYLEKKARDGILNIETAFSGSKASVRENISVLVIAISLKEEVRFDLANWPPDVRKLLKAARDWIAKNNGIKDDSFTLLSLFSGKMPDEVDSGLSASLSSYGKVRGDVAHKSATRVPTILAPSAEAEAVESLITGLNGYFG